MVLFYENTALGLEAQWSRVTSRSTHDRLARHTYWGPVNMHKYQRYQDLPLEEALVKGHVYRGWGQLFNTMRLDE